MSQIFDASEYDEMTLREQLQQRSMWLGSTTGLHDVKAFSPNMKGKYQLVELSQCSALLKILDEILANASDQASRYPTLVTEIKVSFDKETGELIVFNNGTGIPLVKKTLNDGSKPYVAVAAFTTGKFGSNMKSDEEVDRLLPTIGTNGYGAKLTNAWSSHFKVDTISLDKHKEKYRLVLECRKGMKYIGKEKVTKVSDSKKFSTTITFTPRYHKFDAFKDHYENLSDDLKKTIEVAFRCRVHELCAAYAGYPGLQLKVFWNGKNIGYKKFSDFCSKFTWVTPCKATIVDKYVWDIAVGLSDGDFSQVTLVNGINILEGGSHVKMYVTQIVSAIRKLLPKKWKDIKSTRIESQLFIITRAFIDDAAFNGQAKTKIIDSVKKFKNYRLSPEQLKEIATVLKTKIVTRLKDSSGVTRVPRRVNVEKHDPPLDYGKRGVQCTLFVVEGDSAGGTVKSGIINNPRVKQYTTKNSGIMYVGGVINNIRKDLKRIGGEYIVSEAMAKKKWIQVIQSCQLTDFDKDYTLPENLKKMPYKEIIIVTDQDTDGKGNIQGLIVNIFEMLYPELIKTGFVRGLNTPLIRTYGGNGNKLLEEFYDEATYSSWIADNENSKKVKRTKYYKGLGSHSPQETLVMFTNMDNMLFTFDLDSKGSEMYEICYEKDTARRKKFLKVPFIDTVITDGVMTLSNHALSCIREHQQDNITRKLPHMVDGLIPSVRMVLWTAYNKLNKESGNYQIKTNALASETQVYCHYSHGETSLTGVINNLNRCFPTGVNFPMFIPEGSFGTRFDRGENAASPRYTYCRSNKVLTNCIYPRADIDFLKFRYAEGYKCEPQYLLPILPMAILENKQQPATGWTSTVYARSFEDVFRNVKRAIKGKKLKPMSMWLNGITAKIKTIGTRVYSTARIRLVGNTVHVDEFPWTIKSSPKKMLEAVYKKCGPDATGVCKKMVVRIKEGANDLSKYEARGIICLSPKATEIIQKKYDNKLKTTKSNDEIAKMEFGGAFAWFFDLIKSVDDRHLNMIDVRGVNIECKNYEEIFHYWFEKRKEVYSARVLRQQDLISLHIILLKNKNIFSKKYQKYGITNKTSRAIFDDIMKNNTPVAFDLALWRSPPPIHGKKLRDMVLKGEGSSYSYLWSMTVGHMADFEYQKRVKKIEELEQELTFLQECDKDKLFVGATVWKTELDALWNIFNEYDTYDE